MNTIRFFEHYYKNAKVNSIIILDTEGYIVDINQAFTNNFGYKPVEIVGRHFKLLFNDKDNALNKPALELETVLSTGQSQDENYIVNHVGKAIWCTGESILVSNEDGEKFIVKDIVNLQSKRQLQLFLKETEELLEHIFESSKDIPMIIVDSSLKVRQVNEAFLDAFEIHPKPPLGSRLLDLNHPFFKDPTFKDEVSKVVVSNQPFKNKEFSFQTSSGQKKAFKINSKIIDGHSTLGKKIFLILE
jgi:PAS domain S-box-containing protein